MYAYYIKLEGLLRLLKVKPDVMQQRLAALRDAMGVQEAADLLRSRPQLVFRDVLKLVPVVQEVADVLQSDMVRAMFS
jgi:hypothetical protein